MMARRRAGDLRLPDDPVDGRIAVMFMSAACREVPAISRPGRPGSVDLHPGQYV
jgi:hypothetical protein